MLKPGWKYSVRLQWISCKEPQQDGYYPNYDYTLKCESDDCCVIKDDPGGLFKVDYYGGQYYGTSSFPVLDCEAYVLALDLKHERLWETSNKSNRIFNDTPKDDFSGEIVCETDEQGYIWSAHRNELYVVSDRANNTFNVTEKLQPLSIPQEYVSKVMCAAFDGRKPIPGSATHLSGQYEAVMQIQAPQGAKIVHYQIRAGIDSDNDGELSYSESVPLEVYKYQGEIRYAGICGTTSAQCDQFDTFIGGISSGALSGATDVALPVGRTFLSIFYNGDTNNIKDIWAPSFRQQVQIDAFASLAGFSEWLTHNSGAEFSDAGVANMWEYVWQPETAMSNFMAQRTPLAPWRQYTTAIPIYNEYGMIMMYRSYHMATATGRVLTRFFEDRLLPQVITELAGQADGATVTISSVSGLWTDDELATTLFGPKNTAHLPERTQVIGRTGTYKGPSAVLEAGVGTALNGGQQLDDLDAFFSVGRGRLVDPKYVFTARKRTNDRGKVVYELAQIAFTCKIQDLYDFNFEDGSLSKSAAALQIGYGNGNNSRSHGQIYRHEIRINTTYQNPFAN